MDENDHVEHDDIRESYLSDLEEQYIRDWENEHKMADRHQIDKDLSANKLWIAFQNSASSVACLYKERFNDSVSLWIPFQNAAGCVTNMYKDSIDGLKRSYDLGIQQGHQRKSRDILNWVKRKRRNIRRDDLIAYICGKSPSHLRPRSNNNLGLNHLSIIDSRNSPLVAMDDNDIEANDNDMRLYREALVFPDLNGAMSNTNLNYDSHEQDHPSGNSGQDNIHHYIFDDIHNRKRTSSSDMHIESPSRKRNRFL